MKSDIKTLITTTTTHFYQQCRAFKEHSVMSRIPQRGINWSISSTLPEKLGVPQPWNCSGRGLEEQRFEGSSLLPHLPLAQVTPNISPGFQNITNSCWNLKKRLCFLYSCHHKPWISIMTYIWPLQKLKIHGKSLYIPCTSWPFPKSTVFSLMDCSIPYPLAQLKMMTFHSNWNQTSYFIRELENKPNFNRNSGKYRRIFSLLQEYLPMQICSVSEAMNDTHSLQSCTEISKFTFPSKPNWPHVDTITRKHKERNCMKITRIFLLHFPPCLFSGNGETNTLVTGGFTL